MRNPFMRACLFSFLPIFLLGTGCKKHAAEPLVITPTVNPIAHSVLVYLITPPDKSFNPEYYKAVKSCALNLQNWYKSQLGNKTFILNPVVVDTLTGLHNSAWFNTYNGSFSGTDSYAYYNTLNEMQQLAGANFNTTNYTYFVFVTADFGDETKPKGLAAEGLGIITGLAGKNPNSAIGAAGHALGHALGLPEPGGDANTQAIMSTGFPKYPDCVFVQAEKDSLNASPFLATF